MLTSIEIGKRIREFRVLRGLTQEQIAERIDVSVPQFWKYEAGTNRLNTDKLQAVADVLDVPASALLGEDQVVERTCRTMRFSLFEDTDRLTGC
jgi:transcriptional regulator with XRE-family HTH domain